MLVIVPIVPIVGGWLQVHETAAAFTSSSVPSSTPRDYIELNFLFPTAHSPTAFTVGLTPTHAFILFLLSTTYIYLTALATHSVYLSLLSSGKLTPVQHMHHKFPICSIYVKHWGTASTPEYSGAVAHLHIHPLEFINPPPLLDAKRSQQLKVRIEPSSVTHWIFQKYQIREALMKKKR